MRIIHALCTADYTGRGDTTLTLYERIIMIKSDGSILIHSENGTKPLNYMGIKPIPIMTEEEIDGIRTIRVENTRESLLITCHQVHSDITMTLPEEEPGLIRDGTEGQVHAWLADNITTLDENLTFTENEYLTGNGPVDILAHDEENNSILIEVKRVATVASLHQLKRYSDGFDGEGNHSVLLVAMDIRPKTRERAVKMGIPWWELARVDDGYQIKERSEPVIATD